MTLINSCRQVNTIYMLGSIGDTLPKKNIVAPHWGPISGVAPSSPDPKSNLWKDRRGYRWPIVWGDIHSSLAISATELHS